VILLVEVLEGGGEAGGDAVFVVEGDGFLDGAVGEDVAVREVLGYDAGAGLVFLGDGVILGGGGNGFFGGGGGGGGELADGGSGGDVDLGGAELGAIEKEGGFGSAGEEVSWNNFDGVGRRLGSQGWTYVSFSKVTVADLGLSGESEVGVTEREVIFPLKTCEPLRRDLLDGARYQKLKKSRTSFSLVW